MRCKILLLNATIILFLINCDNPSNRYAVRGTIRSLDLNTNNVVIAHDTIADLMPPMVMPFFVPGGELNQVKVGDSVLFEFVWNRLGFAIPGYALSTTTIAHNAVERRCVR